MELLGDKACIFSTLLYNIKLFYRSHHVSLDCHQQQVKFSKFCSLETRRSIEALCFFLSVFKAYMIKK